MKEERSYDYTNWLCQLTPKKKKIQKNGTYKLSVVGIEDNWYSFPIKSLQKNIAS